MGEASHPEVIGIVGSAKDEAVVIPPDPAAVAKLPDNLGRVCLVSQTTQNDEVFARVAAALKPKCEELRIANTICEPTRSHQMEIIDMAGRVDTVVVVGGRHSANTRHLAELAAELGPRVIHVETETELRAEDFLNSQIVGVTAGASTPQWMIQRVVDQLSSFNGGAGIAKRFIKGLMSSLVTTHLHTTAAFASLYIGFCLILGMTVDIASLLSTLAVVFSLHCINEFAIEPGFDRRSRLSPVAYSRFRKFMLFLALFFLIGGTLFSVFYYMTGHMNKLVPIVLCGSAIPGVMYGWKVVPQKFIGIFGFSSIKDLPGSKDLSVSFGWTLLLGIVPAAAAGYTPDISFVLFLFIIFLYVYRRSAIMGVRDAQGDRIVGMESSFKFIGRAGARRLHYILDGVCLAAIVPIFAINHAGNPVYPMLAGLMVMLGFGGSLLYHFRRLPNANVGQFFLDCQFVIPGYAGILALAAGII